MGHSCSTCLCLPLFSFLFSSFLIASSSSSSRERKRTRERNHCILIDSKFKAITLAPSMKDSIHDYLASLYNKILLPLEAQYYYDYFYNSPLLQHTEIVSKPLVLLLGPYSVGKSSFIQYILNGEGYPGIHIGPEPTTDKFVAISFGMENRIIPGNAACMMTADQPFSGLSSFGTNFLSRFQLSLLPAPLLECIGFVDTPGLLASPSQGSNVISHRSYEYEKVCEWFADRSDMILLLFDAHKLDIGEEMCRILRSLTKKHHDKLRIVLNKSDQVASTQELMRVYGALMWSLGKVIQTPEILRVYLTSTHKTDSPLIEAEKRDLIGDLLELPKNSIIRKINEFVKRTKLLKSHCLLVEHFRQQLSSWWKSPSKSKTNRVIMNFEEIFNRVKKECNIPLGDMPDLKLFKEKLEGLDIGKIPRLNLKTIKELDIFLYHEIPRILNTIPLSSGNTFPSPLSNNQNGKEEGEDIQRQKITTNKIEMNIK